MKKYATEQESFWAGDFGAEYIDRNQFTPQLRAGTLNMWVAILNRMNSRPASILELGANIGNNLQALQVLLPEAELAAVEINPKAAEILRQWGKAEVYETSILTFKPDRHWDLVFTSGVLIHINPEVLNQIYSVFYNASNKYICMAEYYSPMPEELSYRGHKEKMYRRNFGGEMLQAYTELSLRGYGFTYCNDPIFLMDDLTWFLLEK